MRFIGVQCPYCGLTIKVVENEGVRIVRVDREQLDKLCLLRSGKGSYLCPALTKALMEHDASKEGSTR